VVKTVWLAAALIAITLGGAGARAQVYQPASDAVNARAERGLHALFAARGDARAKNSILAGELIICGPFLWRNLRKAPGLDGRGMDSAFVTPGAGAGGPPGRTFRTRADVAAFWRAFLEAYPTDPKARIRKLRLPELRLFMSMLPFPAQEPLFAIETGGHRFIFNLDDKLRVFWIDDYLHLP